jgi:hypothetical protein
MPSSDAYSDQQTIPAILSSKTQVIGDTMADDAVARVLAERQSKWYVPSS